MEKAEIIAVLIFACFYIASRYISARAIENLSDEKKLHLVNVSTKGRKYLLLWLAPIILVIILFPKWFYLVFFGLVLFMVIYNHIWVRRNQFPHNYIGMHLLSTILIVLAIPVSVVAYYIANEYLL